jgi:hypothetical protein
MWQRPIQERSGAESIRPCPRMTEPHEDMKPLFRSGRSPRPQRISATLRRLAHDIEDRIRLSDLIDHFGDRTFGAILLIFAIPNLIPLPPGGSTVLGIPLILAAAQLAIGRPSLWLPQAIRNRSLRRLDLERLALHGLPTLRRMERLLVPRYSPLLNEHLIGAASVGDRQDQDHGEELGNMLPALGIMAFSLPLLQRDGLAVPVGWALTMVSLVLVALVSGALFVMAQTVWETGRALLGI